MLRCQDYTERAQDYHRKVGKIKNLKRKAAERNPDEFYYGMLKSHTKNGVHQVIPNPALLLRLVLILSALLWNKTLME